MAPKYNKRLYSIAANISSKMNKDLPSDKKLSSDNNISIHNSLLPFYNWLTGNYIPETTSLEYLMPMIDLESIPDEQIEELCEFYLKYMRDQDAKSSVRKLKSNLLKIDLEHNTELLDRVLVKIEDPFMSSQQHIDITTRMKKYYPFYQWDWKRMLFNNTISYSYYIRGSIHRNMPKACLLSAYSNLNSFYNLIADYNTDFLREKSNKTSNKYFTETYDEVDYEFSDDLDESSDDPYDELFDLLDFDDEDSYEILLIKPFSEHFGALKNNYSVLLYLDLSCWLILQFVIYGIIFNNGVSDKIESIEKINSKIKKLIENFTRSRVVCSSNIFTTFSEFLLFPIFRSYFMASVNVLKQLQESSFESEHLKEEYSLFTSDGKLKKITEEERRYIFFEGDSKREHLFASDCKRCKSFIQLYNSKTGRTLGYDDITLKVIYRELVLDKPSGRQKKGNTILNNFLKNKNFSNHSEYYYINEKINRGMFREQGRLKEFYKKNELQENLYNLVCLFLTLLNPEEIYQSADKSFREIFFILGD